MWHLLVKVDKIYIGFKYETTYQFHYSLDDKNIIRSRIGKLMESLIIGIY